MGKATLFEHREMVDYGANPTACPSGRIPWQEVIDLATIDTEARKQIAIVNLADRWMAMIKLGQLQIVLNEAKALGVVAQ